MIITSSGHNQDWQSSYATIQTYKHLPWWDKSALREDGSEPRLAQAPLQAGMPPHSWADNTKQEECTKWMGASATDSVAPSGTMSQPLKAAH